MYQNKLFQVIQPLSFITLLVGFGFWQNVQAQRYFNRDPHFQQARLEALEKIKTGGKIEPQISKKRTAAQPEDVPATAPIYYTVDEKIAGRSFGEYTGDWLQFIFSRPFDESLVPLEKSSRGIEFQHGPVWFLTPGSDGSPEREMVIPQNVPVFFSLGWSWYNLEDSDPDELIPVFQEMIARDTQDFFYDFQISLDFQPIPHEAIVVTQSPVTYWPVLEADAKAFGFGQARVFSRAGIFGNFVILKPLSAGTHVIKIKFLDRAGGAYVREYYLCVQ